MILNGSLEPKRRHSKKLQESTQLNNYSSPCRLDMFGSLTLRCPNKPVTKFRARAAAELLAYLAIFSNRDHPREVLVDTLWPDVDLPVGLERLSKEVWWIRQELGKIEKFGRTAIYLNSLDITTDVQEFTSLLRNITESQSLQEKYSRLTQAVNLYRGDFLPGFSSNWVYLKREELSSMYLHALNLLIGVCEQTGDYCSATNYAQILVSADTFCEESHCLLIRLFLALGEGGKMLALRQYRLMEKILRDELDVEPSDESKKLLGLIRTNRK